MFATAINLVGNYTRPILMISRGYKSQDVIPGTATLFFVNDEACAVTCKHVAEMIVEAETINEHYESFKKERSKLTNNPNYKNELKKLEKRYGYHSGVTVEVKNNFVDCVDSISSINCIFHPDYDLAIIKLIGYKTLKYCGHAVFANDGDRIQPGDFMCRLGYPFPEFTGFCYDSANDVISWDASGNMNTPRFPIEGMLTRHLMGQYGEIMGYEISTPGLRGQSGGPLFSADGIVYGVQFQTKHLHLGFDINRKSIMINGQYQIINNQPFLHVGECIHVNIIKEFLKNNNIRFYVGDSTDNECVIE